MSSNCLRRDHQLWSSKPGPTLPAEGPSHRNQTLSPLQKKQLTYQGLQGVVNGHPFTAVGGDK